MITEYYKYDNVNRIITPIKNCWKCTHVSMCKFREAQSALASTNMMYEMFEYGEWNNILEIFDSKVRCRFYKSDYVETGDITIHNEEDIVIKILRDFFISEIQDNIKDQHDAHDDPFFFQMPDVKYDFKADTLKILLKTTNKELGSGKVMFDETYVMSDVLKKLGWKFKEK